MGEVETIDKFRHEVGRQDALIARLREDEENFKRAYRTLHDFGTATVDGYKAEVAALRERETQLHELALKAREEFPEGQLVEWTRDDHTVTVDHKDEMALAEIVLKLWRVLGPTPRDHG